MSARVATLLVAFLLGLIAIWSWQWSDYRRSAAEYRAEFERYGAAMLAASEVSVFRECRGGRFDPEGLAEALEEVRGRLGSIEVSVSDATGTLLGRAVADSPTSSRSHLFERVLDPPEPRGTGRGRGGRLQESEGLLHLPPGTLGLRILHPRDELDGKLAAGRRRLGVAVLSLSLVLLMLELVLWLRLRAVGLASRLEAAQERVHALEYLGRLGAGLAHETRNPLGIVRGQAERLARGDVSGDGVGKVARTIVEETDRTVTRLDEFLLLSRPSPPRPTRFSARQLVEELAGLLAPEAEGRDARIEVVGDDFELRADRDQTRRLLLNLLLNALESLDGGRSVRIELTTREDRRALRIADDGRGIPDEIRDTLFEPYVTHGKGGTGLGLSIAKRIADAHGWRLSFEPNRPRGTVMVIEVPRS